MIDISRSQDILGQKSLLARYECRDVQKTDSLVGLAFPDNSHVVVFFDLWGVDNAIDLINRYGGKDFRIQTLCNHLNLSHLASFEIASKCESQWIHIPSKVKLCRAIQAFNIIKSFYSDKNKNKNNLAKRYLISLRHLNRVLKYKIYEGV